MDPFWFVYHYIKYNTNLFLGFWDARTLYIIDVLFHPVKNHARVFSASHPVTASRGYF